MSSNTSSSFSSSYEIHCTDSMDVVYALTAYFITRALLIIPLCILILHLGYQQWRQQRSFSTTSHSDIFTYHMIALEMIFAVGWITYLYGDFKSHWRLTVVGFHLTSMVIPGQIGFHILTCVERYLAVVHPVLYLKLKQSGGVRIRNISTLCVWLFSFLWSGLLVLWPGTFPEELYVSLSACALVIVSFCSLRVLCVLIRPGPGEVGGDRERVDQSKQKAFYTISFIMASLWLWFVVSIVAVALDNSTLLSHNAGCLLLGFVDWFGLPSGLVLPLLFLQRAGKLACCRENKNTNWIGQDA